MTKAYGIKILDTLVINKSIKRQMLGRPSFTEIVYCEGKSIFVYNLYTKEKKKIAEGSFPALSKDGRKLLYCSNDYGSWDLMLLDRMLNKTKRLTFAKSNEIDPEFSYDDLKIIFSCNLKNKYSIWEYDLIENKYYEKLSENVNIGHPVVSFEGKIAYESMEIGRNHDIFEYNPNNDIKRIIAANLTYEISPSYPPVKDYIAYVEMTPLLSKVYIMNTKTNKRNVILSSKDKILKIKFLQDGSGIIVLKLRGDTSIIECIKLSQKTDTVVTCPLCGECNKVWYNYCINCGHKLLNDLQLKFKSNFEKFINELILVEKSKEVKKIKEVVKKEVPKPEVAKVKEEIKIEKEMKMEERKIEKKARKPLKVFTKLVAPTEVFETPSAAILPSAYLEMNLGGGFVGEAAPPMGTIAIGAGGIAEARFATQSILTGFTERRVSVPLLAFKFSLSEILNKMLTTSFPKSVIAIKATWWNKQVENNTSFESRFASFFTSINILSYKGVDIFTGIEIMDARIRVSGTERMEVLKLPFIGGIWHSLPKRSNLLFEIVPSPIFSPSDVSYRWVIIVGSRGFLSNIMSVDIGAVFANDVNMEIRWNIVVSSIDLYKWLTYE